MGQLKASGPGTCLVGVAGCEASLLGDGDSVSCSLLSLCSFRLVKGDLGRGELAGFIPPTTTLINYS